MFRKGKWTVIAIISVVAIIIAATVIPLTYRYMTAEVKGRVDAEEYVQSAEFRIYNYEHFFNACANIRSAEAAWDAQYDKLEFLEKGSLQYNTTVTNMAAIKADIERQQNDYNADAAKEGTRGQFRASKLSSNITIVPHKYGNRTDCCQECYK